MKSNFVKSSEEVTQYNQMIGVSEEEWEKKHEAFIKAIKKGHIFNSGLLAEWVMANSDTPEEAVVLAITATITLKRMQRDGLVTLGNDPGDKSESIADPLLNFLKNLKNK